MLYQKGVLFLLRVLPVFLHLRPSKGTPSINSTMEGVRSSVLGPVYRRCVYRMTDSLDFIGDESEWTRSLYNRSWEGRESRTGEGLLVDK